MTFECQRGGEGIPSVALYAVLSLILGVTSHQVTDF